MICLPISVTCIYGIFVVIIDTCKDVKTKKHPPKMIYLTLIYPAHFEDVPCQSGVNHIFEG